MMKQYDYLIVGAGLFGAVFAHQMTTLGKRCCVVDRRPHIAGNVYTEAIEGIDVHCYGAHIFHTSDREVWDFLGQFCSWIPFINSPIANYHGELYNLPFNMNTFYQMWGVTTPEAAMAKIETQRNGISQPSNLEEQAISLVGTDIYEKLIRGYTEKQWGRSCRDLPAFIIRRLPVRFRFDNNYFNDPYQGIPTEGYTRICEKLLEGTDVILNTDYLLCRRELNPLADRVLYTGCIDEFFGYCYGALEYRSLRFETEVLDLPNYQGVAAMNFTDTQTPYTRIIEHKHFTFGTQEKTVITREYPSPWKKGMEPYYPVADEKNLALYRRYAALSESSGVLFGGRLAEYKYYDMDKVVRSAMNLARKEAAE